jgi:hypothetical protein
MNKYNTPLCNNKMDFEECELAILRQAVDESELIAAKKTVMNDDVHKIIEILESFLQRKPLICYGGTAINNILPKQDQFYNRELEIPDYDFYSKNALNDAIELANIYADAGYKEVEAKSGMHHGTYKVFVNFIAVADITSLHQDIFDALNKDAIKVAGIKYAPANFLRMNMYLELSRPMGDVSRWEKVFKRLSLLNKHYPVNPSTNCDKVEFQKKMEEETIQSIISKDSLSKSESFLNLSTTEVEEDIHIIIRNTLVSMGAIFIGGYACSLYSKYMPEKDKRKVEKTADFDVISEDIDKCAIIVKEQLESKIHDKIVLVEHAEINEIIPRNIEIKIGEDSVAFIYEPIACHSYNKIDVDKKEINVATIDTLLSFYLAFLYSKKEYYQNKDKILCMAMFLFDVQQRNRLSQEGLLKRFSIDCYGKQKTLEDIRTEKAEKFKELNTKKGTAEYDEWFLKYNPNDKRKRANVKSPEKVKREIILSPDAMEKKKKTVNNKKKLHKKISKKISKRVSKRGKTFEKKFLF